MTSQRADQTSFERDLVATAAVTLYSFVVALGFARVFSGWEFMWDLGVLVVVGHGTSFLLRRARVSGWLAIPLTTAILLWVLIAQQYANTMSWMMPRGATWDQLDLEVGLVRDQFQTAVAPVIYGAGWATLAGLAMIVAVVMADSFAFRAEARGETLVPGGVLFVFIAALSSPRLPRPVGHAAPGRRSDRGDRVASSARSITPRGADGTSRAGLDGRPHRARHGVGHCAARGIHRPTTPRGSGRTAVSDARPRGRHHVGRQPVRRHPFATHQPGQRRTVPCELGCARLLARHDVAGVRRRDVRGADPSARTGRGRIRPSARVRIGRLPDPTADPGVVARRQARARRCRSVPGRRVLG